MGFAEFAESLRRLVRGVGGFLALMHPWTAPRYVTRVWCLYELFTATQLAVECHVEVIMPPRESEGFDQALREGGPGGLGRFWEALAATRVEDAGASVRRDRENILAAIEHGPGVARFNRVVVRQLQALLADCAERHATRCTEAEWLLERRLEASCSSAVAAGELVGSCRRAADMLLTIAKHNRAAALLERARLALTDANMVETLAFAELQQNIGAAKGARGDVEGALENYEIARQIQKAMGTLETTAKGAELLTSIGLAKVQRGDAEGALASFEAALVIRETTGTLESAQGATLLSNIGEAKGHHRDFEGALQSYEAARQIREAIGILLTADGATLLTNIGQVKGQCGDFEGALSSYEEAGAICEATGTLETPEGANLLMNLGIAKHQRGDPVGAHASYEAARQIRERLGMLAVPAAPPAELQQVAPSEPTKSPWCDQM